MLALAACGPPPELIPAPAAPEPVQATGPDSTAKAISQGYPATTDPSPSTVSIPELEELYGQALGFASAGSHDQAQDLIFILQDQLGLPLPAETDTVCRARLRSLARRLVFLRGILAESKALASSAANYDSVLGTAYTEVAGSDFPDSLRPIAGTTRPPLAADLLQVDNPAVQKWLGYFTGNGRQHFTYWLERKAAADSLVRTWLTEAGLPSDLIHLALIESGLSPHAVSSAGAVGPWQFMPGTARQAGLRQDWWVDERRDLELATHAAAAYLDRLYDQFGDWALVLAAYNSGENRIARSIRLAGHDNYWALRLPSQTADFVPKFIAATRIASNPVGYGFALPEVSPLAYDVVPVDDATDLGLIARCADVPADEVVRLNPALLRRASPPDSPGYPVRVPAGTGERCRAELAKVPPEERLTWRRHRVSRGETLSEIAAAYGSRLRDLADLNQLLSVDLIRPGDQLLIPMPARLAEKAQQRAAEKGHYVPPTGYRRVSYRVKKGDTLTGIAQRLGVSLAHLRKVNGIFRTSLIHPGQRLYAYLPPSRG